MLRGSSSIASGLRYAPWRRALRSSASLLLVLGTFPAGAQVARLASRPANDAAPVVESDNDAEAVPPVVPDEVAAGAAPAAQLSKEETDALRQQYESLPKERQEEMKAYYKDLGIDLDVVLGLAAAASAEAQRLAQMLEAFRAFDFARTPANVLSARAKIGFGQVPHPNPATAQGRDLARWVHLQVMAGEWQTLADYLSARPPDEAQRVYSQVLQALNRGSSGLLPEEVLALAEACPEEPKGWQVTAWAAMLKGAADKNSPGPMLEKIKQGTRLFGAGADGKRRRTVEMLAGAGLVAEAYEFLPPLDEARAVGDGDLILIHGLYQADLAEEAGSGPKADEHRSAAWDLLCEASLSERASMQSRRDAIRRNIAMMSRLPRSRVTPWLRRVFADDALGPTALEIIALSAVAVSDNQSAPQPGVPPFVAPRMQPAAPAANEEERAQAVLTLKEAVDVLLERENLDQSALRVPLRMLTTSLVLAMENTVAQRGREQMVSREAQLLLRAIPSKRWFDALEPSLAARADRACINIATIADETDLALSLLSSAVRRDQTQAVPLADSFLKTWEMRLAPKNQLDDDMMIYYFWREYIAQAPLTRGRQRRNLERLERLLTTLQEFGVDSRAVPSIAPVFKACHGITEVYERSDIERVFGPIEQIPASTATALAQTMAASLNGDWRNRGVQIKQGVKRTDTEIAQLVDKGYGIALELIDTAIKQHPDSWRHAVVKAGLSYDRMQFRRSQNRGDDSASNTEYTAAAFSAFEQAAQRYAQAIAAGEEREEIGVYERWFGAAMGTSQLNFISADELPTEGSTQDDQIERIKKAIAALPADAAFRHVSDFARSIGNAVARCDPEVKPRLVKHALRIVGDHPAGASLRALDELYRDLVKDEIRLRVTIDGEDDVGVRAPFGVMVSLRFTNSVDRETGGFSKYLQTSAFVRVGRQYQEVNFREKLEKNIEEAFSKGFAVESIGFFDPFMPPQGAVEAGQDGWLEKPLAYVVLSRIDATADRLPQVTMEMQFEDQTGPVTLVLPSNTPPLAIGALASEPLPLRPCPELQITQVVDARDARDRENERAIKLEIICRGKGAVPQLAQLLDGIDTPIEGYRLDPNGIEAKPVSVMQEGDVQTMRYYWGPPKPPAGGYPERDASGIFRLAVERSWVITYLPSGGSSGRGFRLPTLRDGVEASIVSRYFSDMDLVEVVGGVVPIESRGYASWIVAGVAALLLAAIGWVAYRRIGGGAAPASAGIDLPQRITPLSTVTLLRRIAREHGAAMDEGRRSDLQREITSLEQRYFGPGEAAEADGELHSVLARWSAAR